ncbi:30S ribosomal protein S15 [Candidatus Woesearchaeota archaeon]|nr:30S ribosomal protein S15 [Candidatus Woesearchaeota archaeon]|tara:strand:+ start:15566 stop:16021 length:456 start_codon:yes stop_codon:yes gene_type:complete
MARMHSRKHGKSGSTKPLKKSLPVWLRYKPKEAELLIAKLAKEGKNTSEIGIILRDTYGIPDLKLLFKKKLSKILTEKGETSELPDDLLALIRRSVAIRKHMETNNKDQTAKRGLNLTESKIKRLTKYYKKSGKLASEWKYDPQRAGFFTK